MRNKILLFAILTSLNSCCQNKAHDLKCEELFKKYKEKFSTSDTDSTRYYIENAMKCAPEDKNFINNSIQFYIKVRDYKAAITQVKKLKSDESGISLDFMISVLELKLGSSYAINDLQKNYMQYKNDKQLTSSDMIYKVALDNYFNNKNYAIHQLKDYRKVYTSGYDIQNLDTVENLIKTVGKDEVLFSLFNIKNE